MVWAEFARGRVCRVQVFQGPSFLSGAEFVRGKDVQYPSKALGPET